MEKGISILDENPVKDAILFSDERNYDSWSEEVIIPPSGVLTDHASHARYRKICQCNVMLNQSKRARIIIQIQWRKPEQVNHVR